MIKNLLVAMVLRTAWRAIAAIAAIIYIGICLLLWWRQTHFIFFPSPHIASTPAELEIEYEDVWLPPLGDGAPHRPEGDRPSEEIIHAWWVPASSPRVLLYLHGNGINIGANVQQACRFHRLGFSVLLLDYRGYGRSIGPFPTEKSVYQDAEAAWQYLVRDRQIPPEQIYIYGHSLGGAIAIELATHHPEAAGLIVESSLTSMREMVNYQYPIFNLLPVDLLLQNQFNSLAKVRSLQLPLLLIHGTSDDHVPARMSQALFEAAPEPKQLFLVPDADHTNVAATSGDRYFQTIRQFLNLVQTTQQPTR